MAWADGVLVGGQTLRLHGSSCLIHATDLLEQRRAQGLPPQPTVVVWSRSGQIAAHLPFFQQPFERWLLMAATHPTPARPVADGFSRILHFKTWPLALAQLRALGMERVAVLGGAQLAAALVAARALDELQLTLCPMVLGGGHLWLPAEAWSDPSIHWVLLEQAQLEGGEQLLHYERRPAP